MAPYWESEEIKHRHELAEALELVFRERDLPYLSFSGEAIDLVEGEEYPEDLIAQIKDAGIPLEYAQ